MPINAGYEYFDKEGEYLAAQTIEDKIYWLEEMIRAAPKHKSSENFVAELKTRLKKFREKAEKGKKKGKGKKGIRKEGFQFVLVGKTNSGKSSLLKALTNAQPFIADYNFTTKISEIGTFNYQGVKAQVVDVPSIGSEGFDIGLVNTADCLIIVLGEFDDLGDIERVLERARGKKIIVLNKADRFDEKELRKVKERMKSKRIFGLVVSAKTDLGIEGLKKKMIEEMQVVRVYTKEPGKARTNEPIVLKAGSTVKDVAESILKGFSKKVKETRLTGPSGKFSNQKVGLNHRVKDLDVVEFRT